MTVMTYEKFLITNPTENELWTNAPEWWTPRPRAVAWYPSAVCIVPQFNSLRQHAVLHQLKWVEENGVTAQHDFHIVVWYFEKESEAIHFDWLFDTDGFLE